MLNVNRLRILIEVAGRGSFSAAADALSYTQSRFPSRSRRSRPRRA